MGVLSSIASDPHFWLHQSAPLNTELQAQATKVTTASLTPRLQSQRLSAPLPLHFLSPLSILNWQYAVYYKISSRSGPARYAPSGQMFSRHKLINPTAKPASALIPYRTVAALSSTSAKPATAVEQRNATNSSGLPLSVTGKVKREVLLPSQEGKKGAMQYALYVLPCLLYQKSTYLTFFAL